MMRALSHIGLSLAVILAPALCCCNLRWMAAASEPAHCPTCPAPKPAKPSCCQPACCSEVEAQTAPAPTPPKAPPPSCCCNAERPAAALTVTKPQVPAAEFTGEILALVHASAVTPEHAGLVSGLDPPERAGVDARSAALFDRHVMRC